MSRWSWGKFIYLFWMKFIFIIVAFSSIVWYTSAQVFYNEANTIDVPDVTCAHQSQQYYFQESCTWEMLQLVEKSTEIKPALCEFEAVLQPQEKRKIISYKYSPDFLLYDVEWVAYVDLEKVKIRCNDTSNDSILWLRKWTWLWLVILSLLAWLWYFWYKRLFRTGE